jgi:hypothetical protein
MKVETISFVKKNAASPIFLNLFWLPKTVYLLMLSSHMTSNRNGKMP